MVVISGDTGINTIQDGTVTSSDLATSIALTGIPTAPTAIAGTNTTQLATTAFVTSSPTFTGTPTAPTATAGIKNTQIATTAYVDGKMVLGTSVVTTSGTSIDFTGIPTWVKRITVIFNGVSTNGGSTRTIQLGSGSITTSGYLTGSGWGGASGGGANTANGFGLGGSSAADVFHGQMIITLLSGNTYSSSHSIGFSSSVNFGAGGGTVALSGVLDRIRLTTANGTDVFDAGSINIMYEG
jgi:hypothetical protein